MKFSLAAGFAMILGLTTATTGYGQAAMQPTPTTKILAIGTLNPGVDRQKVFEILPDEVRDTANLYLDGKIDQWYSQQNGNGVVFILNVTDPVVAHEMLEKLPLGQAHLMSFELIPLGPLAPLRRLQGMATKP
ncbi:hypothetical protein [Methylocella sp.]|uniref:hypothetical protein n=1 Tax=Methylocella sp. TaxID=1978226 RepID=UPI0037835AE4